MSQELKSIIGQGVSQHLEFKTGAPNVKVLAREVCAFANSGGGTIALGIADDGKVRGVSNYKYKIETIQSRLVKAISPTIGISLTPIEVEGKTVLLIDVPESFNRPYTFEGKVFKRVGDKTVTANGLDIKDILAGSRGHESRWERRAALGMEPGDIDEKELLDVKNTINNSGILGHIFLQDIANFNALEKLNLAESGRYFNSALMLFGKNPTKRYPQMRVRAVRYADAQGDKLKDNRIIEGHAFKVLKELLGFLNKHINISSEVPQNGIQRMEVPAYPSVAIREALMNAIQHRDYESFDGGISVCIYPDRIEIWNSGSLPAGMTLEDLKKPHHSRPHNPDIAHVFFLRGYVERIGSGTRRIIEAFKIANLPEPQWCIDSGGVSVTFRIQAPKITILTKRLLRLLKSLQPGDETSRKEYRKAAGKNVSDRQASIDLNTMVKEGFLSRQGTGRAICYVRTEKELT